MRRPIAGYVLRKRQLPSNVNIGVKRLSNVDIGVNWHIRFMERHPEVAYKHVQRLDEQRAQSTADPDVLKRFYQLIAHQVPAQLFNCDEKGIIIRTARTKGIVSAGGLRRRHYARGNSNRESATALETISAAGAVLPPQDPQSRVPAFVYACSQAGIYPRMHQTILQNHWYISTQCSETASTTRTRINRSNHLCHAT